MSWGCSQDLFLVPSICSKIQAKPRIARKTETKKPGIKPPRLSTIQYNFSSFVLQRSYPLNCYFWWYPIFGWRPQYIFCWFIGARQGGSFSSVSLIPMLSKANIITKVIISHVKLCTLWRMKDVRKSRNWRRGGEGFSLSRWGYELWEKLNASVGILIEGTVLLHSRNYWIIRHHHRLQLLIPGSMASKDGIKKTFPKPKHYFLCLP